MPFEPGKSGNPKGRPKRAKIISDAMRLALNEEATDKQLADLNIAAEQGDRKKARVIASVIVDQAMAGNPKAWDTVLDRMEGKPIQAVEVSGEDGEPIQMIQRVIIDNA